jgi:WxcM-like protein
VQLIQLSKIEDPRGNLSFLEENKHIPFAMARVFWIYDVPGGEVRGEHAYKTSQEFIVALSGSFDVVLHDGKKEHRFHLNRSYYGLLVPKMIWRRMENFSTNSLAMVVTDTVYNEMDYIRDWDTYLSMV